MTICVIRFYFLPIGAYITKNTYLCTIFHPMKPLLATTIILTLWGIRQCKPVTSYSKADASNSGCVCLLYGEGYLPIRAIKCVPSLILGAGR